MKIEDCTQTKDGTPVRIYSTDGGGDYPIHGAILTSIGWKIRSWTRDGHCSARITTACNLDLHSWKDEIPWESLRDEILYMARDESGRWFGFTEYPAWAGKSWIPRGGVFYRLEGVKMPIGPDDWRRAIAKRPEGR